MTARLHPLDIEAIAVVVRRIVREELRKRAEWRQRRGRPCCTWKTAPKCIGAAALGPSGCTCNEGM